MGEFFNFIKNPMRKIFPITDQEGSDLTNLIDEIEDTLKKDGVLRKIRCFDTEEISVDDKFYRTIELLLIEKYRAHRISLLSYKHSLDQRQETISQLENNLHQKFEELAEREKSLEVKEKAYEQLVRDEVKKYTDKAKREIQIERDRTIEKAKSDLNALKDYKEALFKSEFRILDWFKRVEKKEAAIFSEIMEDVKTYQKCSIGPPEDGFQFESQIASALTKDGFVNVKVTEKSGDFGADILAEKDGVKYVIQCKYYSSAVGVKAVQQVFSSKIHYSAHVAVVATNSIFTKAAKVLAEETGVLLWNGIKVQEMLDG